MGEENCMFLHAAHVDLAVRILLPLPNAIITYILQRYRHKPSGGASKSLRLGITAPLPDYFLQVCDAAGLTGYLSSENITGSLSISGKPFLGEEIPDIEGKWFLHSPQV